MNINRKIIITVLQILLVVDLVLLTLPLQERLETTTNELLAYQNDEVEESYISFNVTDNGSLLLSPMKEEDALKTNPSVITISKENSKGNYSLYLKYDKTSDLDDDWLNINVDGKTTKLTDLLEYETEDSKYFLLGSGKVEDSNKDIEFNVRFWIDENVGDVAQGKNLVYSFEIN